MISEKVKKIFTLRRIRLFLLLLGLTGLYAGGLTVRRTVLAAQHASIGEEVPFTLESALHFRRVKMLFDRGFLPEIDPAVQYPEGIRIREIDAVTSEPVQAFLAGWFSGSVSFPERIRWIEAGWFCLGIPLLALAIRIWTGSWIGGFTGGALYAVSLATVLRSTGQEISRENFAFPFLIAAFAFAAACYRRSSLVWPILFALFMALALIGWDMMQYVIILISLGMCIHLLRRESSADPVLLRMFYSLTTVVFLTGLLHPYHRFHGLAYSPLMVWMVGISLAAFRRSAGLKYIESRRAGLAIIMFLPVGLVLLTGLTGAYGASYDHFAELLWAKIRFLNEKPADPSLLTFYQRIMWVPSLHSATWTLTNWMFPIAFWVVLISSAVAWFDSGKRPDSLLRFIILSLLVSIAAFVLFVRFHVFVGLVVAIMAGWLAGRVSRSWSLGSIIVMMVLALSVTAEAVHTIRERDGMGRPNVYYDEMKKLADWLRDEVAPEPVLANMGVSAYIAAYAKCPIVIHPKFEEPSIRRRLQTYGEILFSADELALRDWMDELDVKYLVYAKGEFASVKPEYQMRYFVNQLNPPDTVPARRFERDDESMRYFTRLWGNHKYVVYQALDRVTEAEARVVAEDAMAALQEGSLELAEELAVKALGLDRHQEKALNVMRHVGSLVEQGVQPAP